MLSSSTSKSGGPPQLRLHTPWFLVHFDTSRCTPSISAAPEIAQDRTPVIEAKKLRSI